MKRLAVSGSLILAATLAAGCAEQIDLPTSAASGSAVLGKNSGGTTSTRVPYVVQFSGDVQSDSIFANLDPSDPLKKAEIDLTVSLPGRGLNGAIKLPSWDTPLASGSSVKCENADPADPNTWGPYGGYGANTSTWRGIFWLDRPTGKGIRTWFGINGTMKSNDAAGLFKDGQASGEAVLAFVVNPGTESRRTDPRGYVISTVTYTNMRAGTVLPNSFNDNDDRCVTYTVTAKPLPAS